MIVSHNPAKFANELNKIYAKFDNNDYNNYDAFAMLCKLFFSRSASLVELDVDVLSNRTALWPSTSVWAFLEVSSLSARMQWFGQEESDVGPYGCYRTNDICVTSVVSCQMVIHVRDGFVRAAISVLPRNYDRTNRHVCSNEDGSKAQFRQTMGYRSLLTSDQTEATRTNAG